MNPEMLFFLQMGLVLIPKLGGLIFIIPFEQRCSRGKTTFFSANPMFIPADREVKTPIIVAPNFLPQSFGFEPITALEFSLIGTYAVCNRFFIPHDPEIDVPLFFYLVTKRVNFFEFSIRVDMDHGKRNFAEKGLPSKPKQRSGVLADTPKESDTSEAGISLPDDKNTLTF
jgi:hypothetical protein